MPPRPPRTYTDYRGQQIIIPARAPGESEYTYRNRRSLALYGRSEYQRRIDRGRARGVTVATARGHRTTGGQTEAQRRRQRSLQQYGQTPWEIWRDRQLGWLNSNGFTPQTTGWSWNQLIRAAPKLRWINENTSPNGQITPGMILQANDMSRMGQLEENFAWDHIGMRYQAMYDYQERNDKTYGNWYWFQDREPGLAANWWYYH